MAESAFQFQIELEDTAPLIWRQIIVPSGVPSYREVGVKCLIHS